jgi:Uma2 family endonuclease
MTLTAKRLDELMPDATLLESDEPEMESSLHYLQLALLVSCLDWLWREQKDYFIGANLTIYFSRQQLKNRDFRGPDFFLVKNTQNHPRRSWVVWEEDGKYPDLIIELLSTSTAAIDKAFKKTLYEERFRTQEYFWFSPDTLELAGFKLIDGKYKPIKFNNSNLLWSNVLGLYLGLEGDKLRYFDAEERLVLTPEEVALQEQNRSAILAEKLRELGIDPDELSNAKS